MDSETPDAAVSFARGLDGIAASLDRGEYRTCFHNAVDLTHFSWLLGHNDWIFLCGVLESVYANMADLVDKRAISANVEADIRTQLRADMDAVIESHKGADKTSKYVALRNLRAHATAFQLTHCPGTRKGDDMSTPYPGHLHGRVNSGLPRNAGEGGQPGPGSHKHGDQGPQHECMPLDIKTRYLRERYRRGPLFPYDGSAKGGGNAVPAAVRRRHALVHFGGFGVLCAIGATMAVLTGPFPLNIAVGAAIAALFGADTLKKVRMWRSMALSRG